MEKSSRTESELLAEISMLTQQNNELKKLEANYKQVEEIVRKSEEKFRKIFHLNPVMTAISTMEDGRIIDVNERFLQSFLFSKEEIIGKNSFELGLFAKPAQRQPLKKLTEDQGYAKNIEVQMVAKNGEVIDCLFSAEPITINKEQCWITVLIDITDQKRIELALRESESKHRILLEESPDPIFSFTPEGQCKYANHAFARGVGKPVEEIIGKRIWDVFPLDEANKRFAALSQVFRTGKEKTIEMCVPHQDTDQYYITTINPIKDTNGIVVSAIGISKNITARKKVEKKLHKSYALLKSMGESPKDIVIFALDRQYQYIAYNKNHHQTMKRIWGADIDLGNSMLEYITNPEDRMKAKGNFDRALSGESFTLTEEYGDTALERRYYEDIYNPIVDENGNIIGLTLFLTDITGRRQAEEERERLISELKNALDQVNTLSGLLPICASCKKIRNDKGYWEQIEVYIRNHSEADFSHGLCPECAEKLYPEFYEKK